MDEAIQLKLNDLADRLVKKFGSGCKTISAQDLFRIAFENYGIDPASFSPKAFCYNRIDKESLELSPLFELVGDSEYRVLGKKYPYNGTIRHEIRDGVEYVWGKYENGKCMMAIDGGHMIIERPSRYGQNSNYTRREAGAELRFDVYKKDNYKCQMCGATPAKNSALTFHVDHIKAWKDGGNTVLENLHTVCGDCVSKKCSQQKQPKSGFFNIFGKLGETKLTKIPNRYETR